MGSWFRSWFLIGLEYFRPFFPGLFYCCNPSGTPNEHDRLNYSCMGAQTIDLAITNDYGDNASIIYSSSEDTEVNGAHAANYILFVCMLVCLFVNVRNTCPFIHSVHKEYSYTRNRFKVCIDSSSTFNFHFNDFSLIAYEVVLNAHQSCMRGNIANTQEELKKWKKKTNQQINNIHLYLWKIITTHNSLLYSVK